MGKEMNAFADNTERDLVILRTTKCFSILTRT
jgi:hypothetical protein